MGDDAKPNIRVLAAGAERMVPKAAEEKKPEGPARDNWFVRRIVAPLAVGLALVSAQGTVNAGCDAGAPPVEDVQDADAEQDTESEADADVGPETDVEDIIDVTDELVEDADAGEEDSDVGTETDVEDIIDVTDELVEDADIEEDVGDSEAGEDGCTPVGPYEELVDNPQPDVRDYLGGSTQTQVLHYEVTENCDGTVDRNLTEIEYVFTPPLTDMAAAIRKGINTSHVEVDAPNYRVIAYDAATGCIIYSPIVRSAVLRNSDMEDIINDGDYNLQLVGGTRTDVGGVPRVVVTYNQLIGYDYWNMLRILDGELGEDLLSGNRLMPTAVELGLPPGITATTTILRSEAENITVCEGGTATSSLGVVYTFHETATGWTYIE